MNFKKHTQVKNISGFLLIEIILATSLFALVAVGAISAILYGQKAEENAGKSARAVAVAEESLEVVRNLRETIFSSNLPVCTGEVPCSLTKNAETGIWSIDEYTEFTEENYLDSVSGFLREISFSWKCDPENPSKLVQITASVYPNGAEGNPVTLITNLIDLSTGSINACGELNQNGNNLTQGVNIEGTPPTIFSTTGNCAGIDYYANADGSNFVKKTFTNYSPETTTITLNNAGLEPSPGEGDVLTICVDREEGEKGELGAVDLYNFDFSLATGEQVDVYTFIDPRVEGAPGGFSYTEAVEYSTDGITYYNFGNFTFTTDVGVSWP